MDEAEQVLMGPPLWAPGGVLSALVEEPSAMVRPTTLPSPKQPLFCLLCLTQL